MLRIAQSPALLLILKTRERNYQRTEKAILGEEEDRRSQVRNYGYLIK
jgi:hypothetical protein